MRGTTLVAALPLVTHAQGRRVAVVRSHAPHAHLERQTKLTPMIVNLFAMQGITLVAALPLATHVQGRRVVVVHSRAPHAHLERQP